MNFFTYLKGLGMGASGTPTVAAQQLPVTYRLRSSLDITHRARTSASTSVRVRTNADTTYRIRV